MAEGFIQNRYLNYLKTYTIIMNNIAQQKQILHNKNIILVKVI